MRQIFLALRKSFLILGLMIYLLGLFIFVHPSYAGQARNVMRKGSEAKIQQKIEQKAQQVTTGLEGAKTARRADRPLDVQEEQVKKGAVDEAKAIRDLFTGRKPDGTSIFGSKR